MILNAIERLGARRRREGYQDVSDLTVAAVVAEAQVSRSSFYTQFRDLGDVAVQLFGEVMTEIDRRDRRLRDEDTDFFATRAAIRSVIEELSHRRYLYAVALGATSSIRTRKQITSLLAGAALAAIKRTAPPGTDLGLVSSFFAGGMLAVLTRWLIGDINCSKDDLQSQLLELLPEWFRSDGTRESITLAADGAHAPEESVHARSLLSTTHA